MKGYSQVGQDVFVMKVFGEDYAGFFVDVGCQGPRLINNTLLLEEDGWEGVSFDIVDYSELWRMRQTHFVCTDALKCDFTTYDIPPVVDYLSVDINAYAGARHDALKRLLDAGFEFRVITIEHDAYRGADYAVNERQQQRKLLNTAGYWLCRPDVGAAGAPFEDWWVNPKFFNKKQIKHIEAIQF